MSQLVYLAAVIAVSVVGSLIVYYRNGRPRSLEDNVQHFSRGLTALSTTRTKQRARRSS